MGQQSLARRTTSGAVKSSTLAHGLHVLCFVHLAGQRSKALHGQVQGVTVRPIERPHSQPVARLEAAAIEEQADAVPCRLPFASGGLAADLKGDAAADR